MTTHQHTRTYYTPTSGYPIESRVTLPGDPWVTPPASLAPRPRDEPFRQSVVATTVTATPVIPQASRDTFATGTWTPEQMIAAVKKEQASRSFTSRWEKQAGTGGGVGAARKLATAAMEAAILAAMEGEMAAAQIAKLVNHATATTATALGRMVQDGRVIRRYHIDRVMRRQVGMYRRADQ